MSFGGGSGGGSLHTDTDVALSNPTDGQMLAFNASVQKWQNQAPPTAVDATSSTKGVVELTGDLGGTAASPQVVATHLAAALPVNQGGTGSATQNFVDLSTTQAVAGVKTFSSSPIVPTPTTATQAANKSYVDTQVSSATSSGLFYNVKGYSATGDGTTDDTTAIQNAINAANTAGGGTVYFPKGTYLCNGLVTYGNITLMGSGWGSVLHQKTAAADGTYLISVNPGSGGSSDPTTNQKGITIQNLQLLGNSTETFTQYVHLVNLNAVSDVTVQGCLFKGFRGDGLYLGSGNSGGLERHNERVRILGNTFDGANNNNRNAISIIDGSFVQILGNTFQNCTASNMPGAIDFEPNSGATYARIRDISIVGNSFLNVGGNCGVIGANLTVAQASLTTKIQNITVVGNTFNTCTSNATFFFQHAQQAGATTTPHNIVFASNTAMGGSAGYRPFEMAGVKGARLEGNTWDGFGGSASIGYTYNCADVIFQGNTVQNGAATDGALFAIIRAQRFFFENNYLDGTVGDIFKFTIDSAGASDTIWATGNRVRNGGTNWSSKNASHTLSASTNKALQNDLSGMSNTAVNTAHFAGQPILSYSRSGAGETTALAQWRTQMAASQLLTDSTTA